MNDEDSHKGRKIAIGAGLLLGAGWLMSTPEQRAEAKRRVDPWAKTLFAAVMMLVVALGLWLSDTIWHRPRDRSPLP